MKRTITIFLTNGNIKTLDYFHFAQVFGVPIGSAINHPAVANMARALCANGFLDTENCDEHNITWIGAASISRVSITETITLIKS